MRSLAPLRMSLLHGAKAWINAILSCICQESLHAVLRMSRRLCDCCVALGLEEGAAQKEYRHCRGPIYRLGAKSVPKRLRRLYPEQQEASEDALRNVQYLEKREQGMCYGKFGKEGYYIESGHVEAAIRVLVVRRCMQAGMHWRHGNAVGISATHAHYKSHRRTT